MLKKLGIVLGVCLLPLISFSQNSNPAPGGPGARGSWSRPDKQGFLATPNINLWATIADGIVTELFYPTIDRAQTRDTQLFFVIGNQLLEERKDFVHEVRREPRTLAYRVRSKNEQFNIFIDKFIHLDPHRASLLISYKISIDPSINAKPALYFVHNPACDNTIGGDGLLMAPTSRQQAAFLAFQSDRRGDEPPVFAKRTLHTLVLDTPAQDGTVGFEGVNSPWDQLTRFRQFTERFSSATNGNVAGAFQIPVNSSQVSFSASISFALDERATSPSELHQVALKSLKTPAQEHILAQQQQWSAYLGQLNDLAQRLEPHILILKGLEDKVFPGAVIAAPSLPALPHHVEMAEGDYEKARLRKADFNGGYHRVWPRDLVQMGLAFLAVNDLRTASSIARYLKHIQLPNGAFPQNSWVNGEMSWTAYQLDQTGFPITLISRLVEARAVDYSEFRNSVVSAADHMVKMGPKTEQERWEETKGFSPNSIAVACQGLLEAAWLETTIDRDRSQKYLKTCEDWNSRLLSWTFVNHGPLGQSYFERIEIGDENVDPNFPSPILIANDPIGGNRFLETEIIDGGFLQWILSGLVPPNEIHFSSTIGIYDRVARAPAMGGLGYLRYNHDAYGIERIGRAWPLLSGERAIVAMMRGEDYRSHLNVLTASVSPSEIMAEQTHVSAAPLGWAHAEALIVARSLSERKSFYIPRRLSGYYKNAKLRVNPILF